jgi:hypothetical protein
MSTDPSLDPALDPDGDAGVAPEYAGSADEGVVSSVPEHDPMAGDAEGVVRAELEKLFDLYGDIVALLDNGRLDEVERRWFGVIRETLEFEAALGRVVVPEVPQAVDALPERARPSALVQRLTAFDELNADLSPDAVRSTATDTVQDLEAQRRELLPAVAALAGDVRDRLGEDLRQVMG